MAQIIEMPKLSDTMEEGGIASWLKKEGDTVEEGESLVEIETDKATMEYQSPEGGVLLKILVPAGKGCALNAPIAVIGKKGEKVDIDKLVAEHSGGGKAAATPKKEEKKEAAPAKAAVTPTSESKKTTSAPELSPAPTAKSAPAGGRMRASPLAKKVAAERGVDLSRIAGSGPQGRVVMRDVESAPAGGRRGGGRAYAPTADKEVSVSMMRKTIAKRLLTAKNDAPHFYLTVSADMHNMIKWREVLNAGVGKDPGRVKISMTDLIVYAVSRALREHPQVNASWEGETIREFGSVHVAVAVALPQGLVTPVVRNADQLGVHDIALTTGDLFKRAKAGQLQNEDYAGGTFSISNLGMYGIEEFTAIINPPQAAILAVGATMPTPAVGDDGAVTVQQRMKMTMSCDHRVVDGAVGAQFLQTLVQYIEMPMLMLE